MEKKPLKTIYHYCSVDTFLKIIQNKSFRLSDITKANDKLEIEWFQNIFFDVCKAEINAHPTVEGFPFLMSPTIWPKYACDGSFIRVLAFSFSEKGDLLSQWRGYADDGSGISIGFNIDILGEIIRSHQLSFTLGFKTPELIKVSYNKREAIASARKLLHDSIEYVAKNSNSSSIIDAIFHGAQVLPTIGYKFKNSAFMEEREWRIPFILIPIIEPDSSLPNKFPSDNILTMNHPEFLAKGSRVKTYIDLVCHRMEDLVTDIVVGPKSEATIEDIKYVLLRNGYIPGMDSEKIKIAYSVSSYR